MSNDDARPDIDQIAARIPAHVAQLAVAHAFAVVGSEPDWDSGTIERVMSCLDPALVYIGIDADVPSPYLIEPDAITFWEERLP